MEKRYNAVVGQSGGPTAAINASLAGVIAACLENHAVIDRVYGMKNGMEGFLKEDLVELSDRFADKDNIELLKLTPASALGSCRLKLKEDEQLEKIFFILEKYAIKYFFYIGGNDSMDTVMKLEKYRAAHAGCNPTETRFIGVPKTIDNDLCLTDHTPGFGSAAKYIASSIQEVARDSAVYKQKAVTIVEIMGRDAGWLTASAALSKKLTGIGADLIYLPETPFDVERFLSDVMNMLNIPGKNYVIVAASEGIRDKNGEYVAKAAMSGVKDIFGHAYLSGTGKYLENLVRDEVGCKCRSVELNVLQRCASHISSATDIEESFAVGFAAVGAALDGKSGRMMAFERACGDEYAVKIVDVDVFQTANMVKHVPSEYITPEGKAVTDAGLDSLLPLIAGECPVRYQTDFHCTLHSNTWQATY